MPPAMRRRWVPWFLLLLVAAMFVAAWALERKPNLTESYPNVFLAWLTYIEGHTNSTAPMIMLLVEPVGANSRAAIRPTAYGSAPPP